MLMSQFNGVLVTDALAKCAKREKRMDWQELYKNLEIIKEQYPGYSAVPKPSANDLVEFESLAKIALPKSYKDFAMVFGAGELAGFYRIATPLPIPDDYELGRFNKNLHGEPDERLLAGYGSAEYQERFYFFCSSGGGTFFGWKTDVVTIVSANEYPIYEFHEPPNARKVSESFDQFIAKYILESDARRKWTPRKTFAPFLFAE